MTGRERPLCDCPEPCACYAEGYAAGKDKAYFEVIASLESPPHAAVCACQPLPGEAGLPPESDDAHGQKFAVALRAVGALGPGGQ